MWHLGFFVQLGPAMRVGVREHVMHQHLAVIKIPDHVLFLL